MVISFGIHNDTSKSTASDPTNAIRTSTFWSSSILLIRNHASIRLLYVSQLSWLDSNSLIEPIILAFAIFFTDRLSLTHKVQNQSSQNIKLEPIANRLFAIEKNQFLFSPLNPAVTSVNTVEYILSSGVFFIRPLRNRAVNTRSQRQPRQPLSRGMSGHTFSTAKLYRLSAKQTTAFRSCMLIT